MVTCRSVHTLRGLRGPRSDTQDIGSKLQVPCRMSSHFTSFTVPG